VRRLIFSAVMLLAGEALAKKPPDYLEAGALLGGMYRIEPNITYLSAGGWDGKLDLYLPRNVPRPVATFLNIHGGGWVSGSKNESALEVLPLLAMGFAVVNIDYRLARTAPAPAAVQDCRCALRWVVRHAKQYGFDLTRLVVGGSSAGGHLALMTALTKPESGFDDLCPGDEELRVAAVVNFFGIVDVLDILTGPHTRDFATGWIDPQRPEREKLARWLSPITYVHPGAPPVLTIHGDADPVVPYQHALRLGKALDEAGVSNQLLTVHGGKHGDFDGNEMVKAVRVERQFLIKHGILEPADHK
jgi:acetyl esterase/lipase